MFFELEILTAYLVASVVEEKPRVFFGRVCKSQLRSGDLAAQVGVAEAMDDVVRKLCQ